MTELDLHREHLDALATGDQLGWAKKMIRRVASAIANYRHVCRLLDQARADLAAAQRLNLGLADRVEAQAHLLAKRAEKVETVTAEQPARPLPPRPHAEKRGKR